MKTIPKIFTLMLFLYLKSSVVFGDADILCMNECLNDQNTYRYCHSQCDDEDIYYYLNQNCIDECVSNGYSTFYCEQQCTQ